jgi:hypothetical protein
MICLIWGMSFAKCTKPATAMGHGNMTILERIEFVWNNALIRAIGEGHARPFDVADAAAKAYEAKLTHGQRAKMLRGE